MRVRTCNRLGPSHSHRTPCAACKNARRNVRLPGRLSRARDGARKSAQHSLCADDAGLFPRMTARMRSTVATSLGVEVQRHSHRTAASKLAARPKGRDYDRGIWATRKIACASRWKLVARCRRRLPAIDRKAASLRDANYANQEVSTPRGQAFSALIASMPRRSRPSMMLLFVQINEAISSDR